MAVLKPDFELHHFSDITSDWLKQHNISTIFSDLDSTLAVHDQPGEQEVNEWIQSLSHHGAQLVVVSNNSDERVDKFCDPFGIPGFGDCKKPSPSIIKQHMKEMKVEPESSLFLGDQLLTDVWCGKRLKMKTALVKPIGREHEPIQIVWKRKLEYWIKKGW
ncbi:YqeG family HAD IIIA-type phosphatase [Salsuginibacillus kocurii]|uniref:YqeG family HAD IIIA-type phosphatase n=1 Tax=Salsuginibacillus kocurii TaxID=427078 RepID=UPI00037AD1BD|nr:YqeG family HAD IIIA-type phosphatase [Salsuginibacillus kocurii]